MNTIKYNGKDIPCVDSYDVVVIGGGFAGFSAAVTAASSGVNTLLIERSGELGGMATLAGVCNFCTAGGGSLTGNGKIWGKVIDTLYKLHAIGEEYGYNVKYNANINTIDHTFCPSALSPAMLYIAQECGVNILFQTEFTDSITDNGTLTHIIIHNESMLQAIECKVVIDGSGGGVVAMQSGGEAVPEETDIEPIPPAFRLYLHKGHEPNQFNVVEEMKAEPLPYSVQYLPGSSVILKVNLKGERTTTAYERNSIELETKKRILATVDDFRKNYGEEYYYDGVPAILSVRETRRILGEYVLTADDVRSGKKFDDSIATGCFIIDTVHHHENVPLYDIPYRCLLVKNTKNLMVAGRCLSADRYAMSSARIMITASQMGEAAGAAAALCCKNKVDLRSVTVSDILSQLNSIK